MGVFIKLVIFSSFILILSTYFYQNKPHTENELTQLPYELKGDPKSPIMVVFLHGFPNTFRLWDEMIDDLNEDYFCVNISYPNFAKNVQKKWGLDLEEIANLIKKTVEIIELEQNQKYKKLFVAHDWGSIFAYLLDYHHPKFINELVSLDVGSGSEESIKAKLYVVTYQIYLAANFLVGGHIGKIGTIFFVDYIAKPYGLTEEDHSRIDSSWNYLYYHFWKRIFHYLNVFDTYIPNTPISFIYGTEKAIMFHNEKFLS